MKYLRMASKKAGGVSNKKIQLIVVGKSESGKTSVVKMLMQGKCERIPHDDRTVGVDLSEWDLSGEADGLGFSVKDLAGQDAAGVWNQLFLVKRAIYVLVWRVLPRTDSREALREVSEMVSDWLDTVQLRVPGAHVILVATHVDSATEDEVDEQCSVAKTVAQQKMKAFDQDDRDSGIPSLTLWRDGNSFRVDCLRGAGMEELKCNIIEMARSVPWFGEQIPASYHTLMIKVGNRSQRTPWLTWATYAEMANQCGVPGDHIQIASKVLNDNCALKFFGHYPSSVSSIEASSRGTHDAKVDDFVYIDVRWIVDVLKGLVRHSRDSLLTYFASLTRLSADQKKTLMRHAMKLAIHGVLHKDLVPFLWPQGETPLSKQYWEWVRSQKEGVLWPRPVVSTVDGYSRVISVLLGCEVLHEVNSDEYVAPALLAGTQHYRLDARSFALPQVGMCHKTVSVPKLPDGFFARLLTKLRRWYTHMDFCAFAAALYKRGLKAQVFLAHDRSEGGLRRPERPCVTLHFWASTQKQMDQIITHVEELGLFFPGMCSIDRTGQVSTSLDKTVVKASDTVSGQFTEKKPAQVQIIEFCSLEQVQQAKRAKQLEELQQEPESILTSEQMEELERLQKNQKMSAANQMKDIILQSDKAGSHADNLLSVVVGDPADDEVEWGFSDTNAMRVVLICMDRNIIGTLSPHNQPLQRFVQKFRAVVKAGLAIIPLLFPGYNLEDYGCWWPRYMPEMRQHAIFFDCRDMLSRQQIRDLQNQANEERIKRAPPIAKEKLRQHENWDAAVKEKLLVRINDYLDFWRGNAPDVEAFTAAADRVECPQCIKQQALQPHVFSRSGCQSKLEGLNGQINEINIRLRAAASTSDKNKAKQNLSELLEEQCALGHRMALTDILTLSSVLEALPCPHCLQSGEVPPFCFNRQDILMFLRASSEHPSGKICPSCERAGRSSLVPILDIMLPEIFTSYDWEVRTSTDTTKELVMTMRESIEQSADVFSCSGEQSHSCKGDLQRFIAGCTVVLIFLSDAYCSSAICRREFLCASRTNKYLIPVLMPDWTGQFEGQEDKTWWHHAMVCSTSKDPDTGKMFSWSVLGQFSPIDGRALMGVEDERWNDAVVPEIVKRIQSRFHRGEHIKHMHKQYNTWRKKALLDTLTARDSEPQKLREEALALFQRLDADGSGEIDKSELLQGFPQLDDGTVDDLIADVDLDQDGSICFDELWSLIESLNGVTTAH
jgi:GTPase SAR1 family protein